MVVAFVGLGGVAFAACVGDEPQVQTQADAGGGTDATTGADAPADTATAQDTSPPPVDAADAGDAAVARCDPKKPFATPVLVGALNSLGSNDYEARLSPDELVVYFGSDRGGTDGLYQAARTSTSMPFGAPTPLTIQGAGTGIASPTVSGDELTLVFYQKSGVTPSILELATRSSTLAPFGNVATITNVTSLTQDVSAPYLLPNTSALYYSIGGKIQVSANVGGTFQKGTDVVGVASPKSDTYPAVTPDELSIYWASDRVQPANAGGFDVFVSHRATKADGFSGATNVTELNTTDNDRPSWISPNECVMYLSSERPTTGDAGTGEQHIWFAKRPL